MSDIDEEYKQLLTDFSNCLGLSLQKATEAKLDAFIVLAETATDSQNLDTKTFKAKLKNAKFGEQLALKVYQTVKKDRTELKLLKLLKAVKRGMSSDDDDEENDAIGKLSLEEQQPPASTSVLSTIYKCMQRQALIPQESPDGGSGK